LLSVTDVLLVEHPPTMLRVLRESLLRQRGLRIVGQTGELDRALALASRLRPDVVVVDAEIPGLDVVRASGLLREHAPASAVLVVTLEPDRLRALTARDPCVVAVGKVEGAAALLSAVRRLGRGDVG
jgi:DNA-binding NarL/FixJ family response regulator